MERDELRRLSRWVLASLEDVPAVAIELLAEGLRLSGGTVSKFSQPFASYALDGHDGIAAIQMGYALRQVGLYAPDCDELVERLDGVDAAPWPRLRAALETLREARRLELSATDTGAPHGEKDHPELEENQ